jgi:hypothetical protein
MCVFWGNLCQLGGIGDLPLLMYGGEVSGRRNCYWRAVYSDVVLGARGFYSGGVRDEGFPYNVGVSGGCDGEARTAGTRAATN